MRVLRGTSYRVAGLFLAAVTVVDIVGSRGQTVSGLFAVVPVFVAIDGTRRAILVSGLVALALGTLLSLWNFDLPDLGFLARVLAIVFATAIGFVVYRERTAREQRLTSVTRVANVAQKALLPAPPARVGPLDVAHSYRSAADEAMIGGDFYKVLSTRWGVRIVIGDVRGHGLGVVPTTGMAIGVFREAAHEEPELDRIAARLDRSLARDGGSESFATVLLLTISAGGLCRVLNHGHPPPLVRSAAGRVREADLHGDPPLGLGLAKSTEGAQESAMALADGDELLLTTDGVLEARSAAGEFFPLAQRYARAPRGEPPADVLAALRRDLEDWAPGLHDDSALVLLRYAPRRIRPA
ncbi:PP2C family protein-serine/threonine phosphatase [Streptomyces sp. WMMC500]|uniref:PP2C family protein-serine/threonine phosphatase n=1 Tax=Streptomyces sp. WMMC500 TaxID=3015154 RepID=UPI00248BE4F3|nr:PP2C family protein-serine/threonine phosphatase [Streptomyces sp. WMMC500]WBB60053.1 PP2C family protein-serine/threonine phosphatase [Streptomyces sp. WMMC500]